MIFCSVSTKRQNRFLELAKQIQTRKEFRETELLHNRELRKNKTGGEVITTSVINLNEDKTRREIKKAR